MTFGEKLQYLRKSRGWTQEELAVKIMVSRQALSKWESGMVLPDTENVLKLSDLFGVSTDFLLKDCCQEQDGEQLGTTEPSPKRHFSLLPIIGGIGAALSLAGLLVLGIIGSVRGENYSIDIAAAAPVGGGVESEITYGTIKQGFPAYLEIEHLEWLFWLLIVCTAVGLLAALTPVLQRFFRQRRMSRSSG